MFFIMLFLGGLAVVWLTNGVQVANKYLATSDEDFKKKYADKNDKV